MVSRGKTNKTGIDEALVKALGNLLIDNSIENIKVIDICKEANIPRSTFYYHFNDKYELLEYMVKSLTSNIANEVINNNPSNIREYYSNLEKIITHYIYDNKELYSSIILKNEDMRTLKILGDIISDDLKERLYEEEEKGYKFKYPVEVVSEFYVGGISRLSSFWMKNIDKYGPDDLYRYLDELTTSLFE
ncbi:TetR/AcrR family transcriptional regulator [Methanobrevibacter sp. AbM4]|uniref:TetR/AcrR family transcriptional regulator n=1 Tax=Methanobrevibacter sp. AbM4 TaxID=224719 RepID=UPI0003348B27|nr:TetR/AcrR family transcriptional regulator [Methanobrevibacter sp. AbM4]AGN17070.1 transcriptional regulator TetR family [Methanobrevibacter sp. AbM4]